jgi:hypothetical protein
VTRVRVVGVRPPSIALDRTQADCIPGNAPMV